jgi:hypothetical protein
MKKILPRSIPLCRQKKIQLKIPSSIISLSSSLFAIFDSTHFKCFAKFIHKCSLSPFCLLSCPEFSLGGVDSDPVSLDAQLEFLSTQISSELQVSDVVIASEGHVALSEGKSKSILKLSN